MDLLYEHGHDDGNPIQDSGEVANNYSWPTKAGEEEITPLNGHGAAIVMSCSLQSKDRTLDPLEYLPPELSTLVITQALPPQKIDFSPSVYPSRLIELTTVSKKWQSFLFSTPVLWGELYIDERQEDFLVTLSVFVRLSSDASVKLFLCNQPTGINWTGLASTLLPAAERVTCLNFGIVNGDDFEWVPDALSNLLERLRLPALKEVNFDTIQAYPVRLFRIKALGLPSTVKFNPFFRIELPESCWVSGTRSKFFDVTKCNTSGTLGWTMPPSHANLLVEYLSTSRDANIISNGATLLQLESLAERLTECNCFEQVMHTATFSLHRLQVETDLSQTEDLLDCLRMLMHLQDLKLRIRWADRKVTRDHTPSDTARLDLRKFELMLPDGVEDPAEAQKPLGDLLSALGTLYPGVEEVHLWGRSWMSIEASYLRNLRALKSLRLHLASEDSPVPLPSGSITLQSVQYLEMRGVARIDNLCTPNLLKLVLQLGGDVPKLGHLSSFPRGLRSLAITLNDEVRDLDLASLDCPDLRDLYLANHVLRASWGHLSLPNLVSIQVGSPFQIFTDPSSNQLCITLLCYPWRLPSLRELHFAACVEWDVLFLMLKRRNWDKIGVQRIDMVTLPFVPFAFHKLLARLLAGEIVELPSLISLSLEATREVIFDSSVPGCFACMKHLRPGCTGRLFLDEGLAVIPADIYYPPEDPVPEELPREVQDWLSQRRALVDIWKVSYGEFAKEYSRWDACDAWHVRRGGFS